MPDLELKDVVKAVEGVNVAFEAFKKTNDDNLAKRDVVTEEKLTRIEASIAAAQAVADEAVLAAKRSSRVITDGSGNAIDLDKKAHDWAELAAKRRGDVRPQGFGAEQLAEYDRTLNTYLRKGEKMLTNDELKALSVGSDVDGGYMVTPDTSGRMVARIFETSPIMAYASIQAIGTDALEGDFDNDEASAGWVGETQARTETDTPGLGTWRIPVRELFAKPKATQRLLDDANFNVEQWLAGKVGAKLGRKIAKAAVSGSGVIDLRGFLTYANYASPGVFEIGAIEQFKTGVNGGFAAAPNGVDVLIDTLYGLLPEYRANANWFMSRATTGLVRKIKDSDGAYVWQPGAQAGQPSVLLNHGVVSFEDMPSPATGSLSIAFGDMREAYQIVERAGERTLRDPYSAKPFVEFYTTRRVGGDVINFEALKLVQFAA